MKRFKNTLDYIREVSRVDARLSSILSEKYQKWSSSLSVSDFEEFMEIIAENGTKLGLPQYYGKFRAVALEEYVYRTLLSHGLQVFWRPSVPIGEIVATPDIIVEAGGKRAVIECKVELDASRLKVSLGDYLLLKYGAGIEAYFLVYYSLNMSEKLLAIARSILTGVYYFKEIHRIIDFMKTCLKY